MDKQIDRFLKLFDDTRKFLLSTKNLMERIPPLVKLLLLFLWLAAIAIVILSFPQNTVALYTLGFLFLILYFIYGAYRAIDSCRKLLIFWLWDSLFVGLIASSMVYALPSVPTSMGSVVSYGIFLLVYAALWLLLAGAANNDAVKMGCALINTCTTILLIGVNVIAAWGRQNTAWPWPQFWNSLQDLSVLVLLPLVVSGYLAALLNELQGYWTQKKNQ